MKDHRTIRAARDAERRPAGARSREDEPDTKQLRRARGGDPWRSMQSPSWANVRLVTPSGQIEIDRLILARQRLYVVETKDWSGKVTGSGSRWTVSGGESPPREIINPLPLVQWKARLLAYLLQQELGTGAIPVEGLVVITHPDAELAVSGADRDRVLLLAELLQRVASQADASDAAIDHTQGEDSLLNQTVRQVAVRHVLDALAQGRVRLRDELLSGVRSLVRDLRERGRLPEVHAVAWTIWCSFVRTLEERGLLDRRWPTDGWSEAGDPDVPVDAEGPATDRLREILQHVTAFPAAATVLGEEVALLRSRLPDVAARTLLAFFGQRDATGAPRWSFVGAPPADLYEEISTDRADATSALATPSFVADLLLDRTLGPAMDEFSAVSTRVLDPACGSGLLLGKAFKRLFERLQQEAPRQGAPRTAAQALDLLHGADSNPIAVLFTRVRLLLAYLDASGVQNLVDVGRPPLHVVRADSLLAGRDSHLIDPRNADVFEQRYEVVVTEPPHVTPKDPRRRQQYRQLYPRSASKVFSMDAPFIEMCFGLAAHGGFVGVFAGTSFARRLFGKRLVEDFLRRVDITEIIDTSMAYIPGRAIPTLLLVGRNRQPRMETVKVVTGKGTPSMPGDPLAGRVWSAMVSHLDHGSYEDEYVRVGEVPRSQLARHPWFLTPPPREDLVGGALDAPQGVPLTARAGGDVFARKGRGASLSDFGEKLEKELERVFRDAGWRVSPAQPRGAYDILVDDGEHAYAVELKVAPDARRSSLQPLLADALLRARWGATRTPGARPLAVVGAPHISDTAAENLRAYGSIFGGDDAYGWIDTEGRLWLSGPGLSELGRRGGRESGAGGRRLGSFDPFSETSQWLLKVLLAQRFPAEWLNAPREPIPSAVHLAEIAEVSPQSASRLVSYLRTEGFLPSVGPLDLSRPLELLHRWREAGRRTVAAERAMCFRGRGGHAAQRLDEELRAYASLPEDEAPQACVGLFAAADRLGFPFVHGVPQHLYVERCSADALNLLGLIPAQSGQAADVMVRSARRTDSVFRGAVLVDGVPVSDILQTWLDVGGHPARGEEQADYLMRTAIKPYLSGRRR